MFDDPNSVHQPVIMDLARAIPNPTMTGVVFQMMGAPPEAIKQKEYEMPSRTKTLRSGKITAPWPANSTTGLPVPAQYIKGLTISHQIQIDDEIVIVSAVNRAANTIDVFARGMCGTTPTTHGPGEEFDVIGSAGRDVDLHNVESTSESTIVRNNYVQTVFEIIEWEKSAELERRGIENSSLVFNARKESLLEALRKLSKAAVRGRKNKGSASQPFTSNGLLAALKDTGKDNDCPIKVFNANNAPLNETMLHDALDMVFDYGSPDTIILNSRTARRFKAFLGAGDQGIQTIVHTDRADTGVGRHITHYDYNGSSLRLLIDRDMPESKIAVVTAQDLKKGWLEDDALKLVTEPAKNSRLHKESIQGTIGFLVENVGYNHILIENLATD
jgi:hypothetical protein